MPTRALKLTESSRPRETRPKGVRRSSMPVAAMAACCASLCLVGVALAAQTPATPAPAHTPAPAPAHLHKKSAAAKTAVQPTQPVPLAPPTPPLPNWPANDKPMDATIVWDSHGLFIQAANSSLDQILREVALKTGAAVKGMGPDERVFGAYGPGSVREVLTQLLDGSGYNILMVGDLGEGTPRSVLLSGRPTGPAPPSNGVGANYASENDSETDVVEPPPPPPPAIPTPPQDENGAPIVPVRTPQQLMQDRQQLLQQQQQQQQPQNNSQ